MKKVYFLFILIFTLFIYGCNFYTPSQAITPPVHTQTSALKNDNLPIYSIKGNDERFLDTEFIGNNTIATLIYKYKLVYIGFYQSGKLVKERELGKEPDYRIISCNNKRILLRKGNDELLLFDSNLSLILDIDMANNKNNNVYINGILSPESDLLVVSSIYYDNKSQIKKGTLKIYENEKLKYSNENVAPLICNFSKDGKKFLYIDISNPGRYDMYVTDTNGVTLNKYAIDNDANNVLNNKDINENAWLSADGKTILFTTNNSKATRSGKLYIYKEDGTHYEYVVHGGKYYINDDGSKIITGNYGVTYIYKNNKLSDSIVVNYGIINDVFFSGEKAYFAINGTTVPKNNGKDYIGVMNENGSLIWTSKTYDIIAILKFSKDGKRLLGQSSNGIYVYDYSKGSVDTIVKPVNGRFPEKIWQKNIGLEYGGKALIKLDESENIYIAHDNMLEKYSKNGNRFWINNVKGNIENLAVSQNGESLISLNNNGVFEVIKFDKNGMITAHKYIKKGHSVTSLAISTDGKHFAYAVSTPDDKENGSFIDLFNEMGYMLWEQKLKGDDVYSLNIIKEYVSASYNGKQNGYIVIGLDGNVKIDKRDNDKEVYIKQSDDGNTFFTKTSSGNRLYNNSKIINISLENNLSIRNSYISDNGDAFIEGYNMKSGKYELTFINGFKVAKKVSFDWIIEKACEPDDVRYIAILSKEYENILNNANRVTLYDLKGNVLYNYYTKTGISDIAISDDGMYLYMYSCDGNVYRFKNR